MNRNMEKLRSRAGFTLIETMITLLILVILVMGMDSGMQTAVRVYKEATFFADSHSLASMLDTSLGDVLRYSEKIFPAEDLENQMGGEISCVFTNAEYGMKNAYIDWNLNRRPCLWLRNTENSTSVDLLNGGAFPDMTVTEFTYRFDGTKYVVNFTISSLDNTQHYAVEREYLVLNPD